ncbi:bifunctional metallophosphatase/5'-nucleotidase, partial [Chloroflexus sp.]|uniref:bifunctional metallophosphatase/5'-nucleotidase n=1 Tax=Chloroflexus sp. TaxID=1904827 RepID=UPI002ACE90B6
IGNHEFDRGQQPLAAFINGAQSATFTPPISGGTPVDGGNIFPVISANIQTAASSPLNGLIQPNTVITLPHTGKKIGIFGLTTPETAILSSPGPGVTFREDLEAVVAEQVAALQAQNVDAIIALTHIGYTVDLDLAQKTSGISLIIGGHSHTPLGPQPNAAGPYPTPVTNKDGESVPVFTDWEWGRWLGEFLVGFDAHGRVTSVTGAPVEVVADSSKPGYVEPNAAFEARIKDVYAPPLEQLRNQEVGSTAIVLNGNRSDVRTGETNLGNLIADAILNKTRPDLSKIAIMNGGGIRTSIDAGPVTLGEVLEVLPFGNTIALVDLTGAQVKAALENGVSQVETAQGRFPQVAGIRFTFTPNRPAGERILSLEVANGDTFVPIDPATTYRVATNNFMLGGGDGYSVFTEGKNKVDTGFLLSDVVADYIGTISPVEDKDIPGNRITRVNYMWLPLTVNMRQTV